MNIGPCNVNRNSFRGNEKEYQKLKDYKKKKI